MLEFESMDEQLKEFIISVKNILDIQIAIAKSNYSDNELLERLSQKDCLGYMFGFVDGCGQGLQYSDLEKYTILQSIFRVLFGLDKEDEANKFTEEVINLQSDKDFNFCREVGGQQAINFLRDKKEPMGLSHLLLNYPLDKVY